MTGYINTNPTKCHCGMLKRRMLDCRHYTDTNTGIEYILRRGECVGCKDRNSTYELSAESFARFKNLIEERVELKQAIQRIFEDD